MPPAKSAQSVTAVGAPAFTSTSKKRKIPAKDGLQKHFKLQLLDKTVNEEVENVISSIRRAKETFSESLEFIEELGDVGNEKLKKALSDAESTWESLQCDFDALSDSIPSTAQGLIDFLEIVALDLTPPLVDDALPIAGKLDKLAQFLQSPDLQEAKVVCRRTDQTVAEYQKQIQKFGKKWKTVESKYDAGDKESEHVLWGYKYSEDEKGPGDLLASLGSSVLDVKRHTANVRIGTRRFLAILENICTDFTFVKTKLESDKSISPALVSRLSDARKVYASMSDTFKRIPHEVEVGQF